MKPELAKLVRTPAAIGTVENPTPRDLCGEESSLGLCRSRRTRPALATANTTRGLRRRTDIYVPAWRSSTFENDLWTRDHVRSYRPPRAMSEYERTLAGNTLVRSQGSSRPGDHNPLFTLSRNDCQVAAPNVRTGPPPASFVSRMPMRPGRSSATSTQLPLQAL